MRTIYLDMDGTIANTYEVDNWRPRLLAHDASVFMDAEPADKEKVMELIELLGGNVVVLTMLPEHTLSGSELDAYYDEVKQTKIAWLAKHFPEFDKIEFVDFEETKSSYWEPGDVLIDDSSSQLRDWPGMAIKTDWALPLEEYFRVNGK